MKPTTLLLAVLLTGCGPRAEAPDEAYAGCSMPSHPTQRDIDDCHAHQRKKRAAEPTGSERDSVSVLSRLADLETRVQALEAGR